MGTGGKVRFRVRVVGGVGAEVEREGGGQRFKKAS